MASQPNFGILGRDLRSDPALASFIDTHLSSKASSVLFLWNNLSALGFHTLKGRNNIIDG